MAINYKMWGQALRTIPRLTPEEFGKLDIFSKWLISTRAAVFIMTALSAGIGGLLAYRDLHFDGWLLILCILGLVLAHASNNMLNDYVDHRKGVDKDNYYRAQYGPQPLEHGLMKMKEFMTYLWITGLLASAIGLYLILTGPAGIIWFFAAGLFFLLFYTWPLKYYGLGEPSVILVWGPLMVGGTYFVVSGGYMDNAINVILISLVYALGPTTVLFGKHTDKLKEDKAKGIYTLPVILGQKASRYTTIGFWIIQYLLIIFLVATLKLHWIMLITLLAIPKLVWAAKVFSKPRPESEPAGLPPNTWPLYLSAHAFVYNRQFGLLFLLGLIAEMIVFRVFL
jgi:1,4-dihydroxy-2-naphthoate polyprenyltransferase